MEGPVTPVRDGGTIGVAGVPVRIAKLDCAKMDANEGQGTGLFLRDLVRGQSVTCNLESRRSHDREVRTCALTDSGEDVGEILMERACGGGGRRC